MRGGYIGSIDHYPLSILVLASGLTTEKGNKVWITAQSEFDRLSFLYNDGVADCFDIPVGGNTDVQRYFLF